MTATFTSCPATPPVCKTSGGQHTVDGEEFTFFEKAIQERCYSMFSLQVTEAPHKFSTLCRARNQTCQKCKKHSHFASVCRRNIQTAGQSSTREVSVSNSEALGPSTKATATLLHVTTTRQPAIYDSASSWSGNALSRGYQILRLNYVLR